jgi:dipeptidyl aminopeptidase/acylaminoacyl peptidase
MKWWIGLVLGIIIGAVGVLLYTAHHMNQEIKKIAVERPLLKYGIENLGNRKYESEIIMDDIVASEAAFFVQNFHFNSDGKNVTGLAHIPNGCVSCPVIVQIRGYADSKVYVPGYGTAKTAEKFAQAGFISLAPDFLGYGGSASASGDVWEARFETYTTTLNFLAAVKNWDLGSGKIGIWGHSNGGQIALTVLEISQAAYPTVLWAPVTAPFPYSILYYMNDNEEGDKLLRKELVNFEDIYDTGLFNLLNYTDRINAPIQLEQGTADDSVPVKWSDNLVNKLKISGKEVIYYIYPGADHNLLGDWDKAVERDVAFFKKKLGLTE